MAGSNLNHAWQEVYRAEEREQETKKKLEAAKKKIAELKKEVAILKRNLKKRGKG